MARAAGVIAIAMAGASASACGGHRAVAPQGDPPAPEETAAPAAETGKRPPEAPPTAIATPLAGGAWKPMATEGAPAARVADVIGWSAGRVVVWGGYTTSTFARDGGLYDPTANRWTPMALAGAPGEQPAANPEDDLVENGRGDYFVHARTAKVWVGGKLVVWGGASKSFERAPQPRSAAVYDPAANRWSAMPKGGGPTARTGFLGVGTGSGAGSRFVVWGGFAARARGPSTYDDGFVVDLAAPSPKWSALPRAKIARARPFGGASDEKLVVWGGCEWKRHTSDGGDARVAGDAWDACDDAFDGAAYDFKAKTWTAIPPLPPPGPKLRYEAHWTGGKLVAWAGASPLDDGPPFASGAVYDPATNAWTPMPPLDPRIPVQTARARQTLVTEGAVVFLGVNAADGVVEGVSYDVAAARWSSLARRGAPRLPVGAGWTDLGVASGGKIFVDLAQGHDDGIAVLDLAANVWERIPAPPSGGFGSTNHVWTGGALVAWGGFTATPEAPPECALGDACAHGAKSPSGGATRSGWIYAK